MLNKNNIASAFMVLAFVVIYVARFYQPSLKIINIISIDFAEKQVKFIPSFCVLYVEIFKYLKKLSFSPTGRKRVILAS